ncbi:MAG: ABC transporter substrate-binding protein [Candidatus Lustribacter sp.]|jgi:NitT/TauT family transport system substrate-binding protein
MMLLRSSIDRGRFLTTGAAAAVALAPRRSFAQALTTLRVTAVPNDDTTPLLYAQQSGLFRRAGLDVTITPSTSGAAIAAAVVSGSYDIGLISMMASIAGHVHGLPFVMIAPSLLYLASNPTQELLVLKDSPIRSVSDLAGKVVACSSIRDVGWVSVRALADQRGIDSSTIKFVELPMVTVAAALEAHRIDAGSILNPTLEEAMATGHFRTVGAPFDGIAKRWLVAAWCTTTDFVAKNRDVVDRFASVMRAATAYSNSHHTETAPLIATFTGIDLAHAVTMQRVDLAEYLDPRDVQPAIDAAAKYGVIDKGFPAQELISPYAIKPPR